MKILQESYPTVQEIKELTYNSLLRFWKNERTAQIEYMHIKESAFRNCKKWYNSLQFPMKVYRSLDISAEMFYKNPETLGVRADDVGIHWTTDPELYYQSNELAGNLLLSTVINKDDVDWDRTLPLYIFWTSNSRNNYDDYPENELLLKKGPKFQDCEVEEDDIYFEDALDYDEDD